MIKLWDVATSEELYTMRGHAGSANSVVFSPDGLQLASSALDQAGILWDPDTGKLLAKLKGDRRGPSTRISHVCKQIASTAFGQIGILWNKNPGELQSKQEKQDHMNRSVAFSPNGRQLAFGSDDHTIKLWDVATREHLATLEGHVGSVKSVVYSPDGRRLASASNDHTIKLWDVATSEEMATLEGHRDWVNSVAFSPDGKRLASASDDGTIKLWDSVPHAIRYRERQEYLAAKSMMESIVDRRLADGDDAHNIADAFRDDLTLTNLQRRAALNILLKRCDEERLKKQRDLILEQIDVKRRRAEHSDATANELNSCAWALLTAKPADLRDPPLALIFALRACELTNFKDPTILDPLALAYHLTGDHVKAVETVQNALNFLSPDDSRRYLYEAALARCEAALKDDAEEVTQPSNLR